jgi:hypothetical protein
VTSFDSSVAYLGEEFAWTTVLLADGQIHLPMWCLKLATHG